MNTHQKTPAILLIYTGGTIGMIENPVTGVLEAFNLEHLLEHVTELKSMDCALSSVQFTPPLDSSSMGPESWVEIVKIIVENYALYDGFVVLHGTDTMAYTASALSFMLENLDKPVILTGSQLPIGMLRTDGKENLITAIEIAVARENDTPIVPEVCIYFENVLLRGNRTCKTSADYFNAFTSYNYPPLAKAGVTIQYDRQYIHHQVLRKPLKPNYQLDHHITFFKVFPGMLPATVEAIFKTPGLKAIVMETYGSGNAPADDWFLKLIKEAVERDIIIVNITQCRAGMVEMQRYETGFKLMEAGVISGYDSTAEAALTKLMYLFGLGLTPSEVKERMNCSLAGEITVIKE